MGDKKAFEELYKKYDGRYGDAIDKLVEYMKLTHRMAKELDKLINWKQKTKT